MTLALPEPQGATRLVLVRHAETDEAMRDRCYGRLDVALSPAGSEQAAALARGLATLPLAAVYTSPRVRALDTARPVAAAHGLEPRTDADLRELDFGELEGLAYEEIEAAHPELWRRWMTAPTAIRFPGGECLDDLRRRVRAATRAIRANHHAETTVLVTHGGPIRAVLADALRLPDEAFFRLDQPYGGVSVVDWPGSEPVVRAVNALVYSAGWPGHAAR
jgi:alpha-ribazole phosphatase/probable phosphoglycerate mutase